MTKIIKWWQKFSFWMKMKSVLAALGIGGEVALFMGDSGQAYKWLVAGATVVAIIITHLIEDKDNNGVADLFE
jgi:hypothetical protein